MEEGIRGTVLDFNAAGEERVPENMGFAADSSSCNAKTLCASLNETLKLADIPDPVEEIEDSEEVRLDTLHSGFSFAAGQRGCHRALSKHRGSRARRLPSR